ncbi:MAG: methionine gamma-lyase family protein, partial [Clostridia bacterium]|nr:methionine gamma-lyase family protein [Clostridia bacterium]
AMPGYRDQVIMAAGTFVQGASIELSADGPLRPPYTAFFQGGLTFESGRIGVLCAAAEVLRSCGSKT